MSLLAQLPLDVEVPQGEPEIIAGKKRERFFDNEGRLALHTLRMIEIRHKSRDICIAVLHVILLAVVRLFAHCFAACL